MTLEEVKAMLDKTGLPVVYREWPQNPEEGLPPLRCRGCATLCAAVITLPRTVLCTTPRR